MSAIKGRRPALRLGKNWSVRRSGRRAWRQTGLFAWQGLMAMLLVLAAVGCDRRDGPETYPVRGSVTLDGKPVSFGGVRFHSDGGRMVTGEIQSDGAYSLRHPKWGTGAVPGHYQVSVQVREMQQEQTEMMPAWPGPSLIPEKYEDPISSGLEFDVSENENRYDIELISEP